MHFQWSVFSWSMLESSTLSHSEACTIESCFYVIEFYCLQSQNVVWLANPALAFEITVLPVCSNQWEPLSHELYWFVFSWVTWMAFFKSSNFTTKIFFFLKTQLKRMTGLFMQFLCHPALAEPETKASAAIGIEMQQ